MLNIGLFDFCLIFIVKRRQDDMEALLIGVFALVAYPLAKRGLEEIIIDSATIIAWVLSKIIR